MEQGSSKWKKVIGTISEMLAEYVVGIGLAAVIFVPAVLGFLGSNRASVKINVPLTMSWTEIKAFGIYGFADTHQFPGRTGECSGRWQ